MWNLFGKKPPPFSLEVCDQCGCLVATISHEVTAPFSKKFAKAIVGESNRLGIDRILTDVSLVTSSASAYDSHLMAEKYLKKLGLSPDTRIAILTAADDNTHDVVATALNSAGYNCSVFRSREHAIEWLNSEKDQAN